MCGRFTLHASPDELQRFFDTPTAPELVPRYNVAPGQAVTAVRAEGAAARAWASLRWGLVPSWAKSPEIGARMINARSETASAKPAFRAALRRRRCLIPASGWFEWSGQGRAKAPWLITAEASPLLALAGLWERWHDPHGELLETATILTRAARGAAASVHARMPVIVAPDDFGAWLDPATEGAPILAALLQRGPGLNLALRRVSRRVNRVANDDPACLDAAPEPGPAPTQGDLF